MRDREKAKANHKRWRERNQEKIKVWSKRFLDANRERVRARNKEWMKNNPEKANAASQAWALRNPEKRKAHWLVKDAIRAGRLKKPSVCQRCRVENKLHGHHADYAKPLEVEWLCERCHAIEHWGTL